MTILTSAILAKAGFLHAFPTRDTVDATLLAALTSPTVIQVKQVHGARAVLATEAAGQEGDALVSRAVDGAVGWTGSWPAGAKCAPAGQEEGAGPGHGAGLFFFR